MTKQLVLRIDDKLKSEFARLAKSGGKTTSELLQELMENLKKNMIYQDMLMDSGNVLKSK